MEIDQAIEFMKEAHGDQMDQGGNPYWMHPIAVMQLLPEWAPDEVKIAAILHDVLEDTNKTSEDLHKAGFTRRTVQLVEDLSREKSLTYMEWIKQIAASNDYWLIRIKLADNLHNSDPKRLAQLPLEKQSILNRYTRARRILEKALNTLTIPRKE